MAEKCPSEERETEDFIDAKLTTQSSWTMSDGRYLLRQIGKLFNKSTPTSSVPDIDAPFYNMSHSKRGYAAIICNDEFDPRANGLRLASRIDGTEADLEKLRKLSDTLKFEATVHKNLTVSQITQEILDLSRKDFSDCDCVMVVILTHGDQGNVLEAKDDSYKFEDVWEPFSDNLSLAGKPKLFFVQACKGTKLDSGKKLKLSRLVQTDSSVDSNSHQSSYTIPTKADLLFGFSTTEGNVSWREKDGSWFIQVLCDVICEEYEKKDLLKMMTTVCRRVAIQYASSHVDKWKNNKKEMPCSLSTLTRDIYFTFESS